MFLCRRKPKSYYQKVDVTARGRVSSTYCSITSSLRLSWRASPRKNCLGVGVPPALPSRRCLERSCHVRVVPGKNGLAGCLIILTTAAIVSLGTDSGLRVGKKRTPLKEITFFMIFIFYISPLFFRPYFRPIDLVRRVCARRDVQSNAAGPFPRRTDRRRLFLFYPRPYTRTTNTPHTNSLMCSQTSSRPVQLYIYTHIYTYIFSKTFHNSRKSLSSSRNGPFPVRKCRSLKDQ